jgi:hypothetical protein
LATPHTAAALPSPAHPAFRCSYSRPQLNPHLYYRKWCYVEEIIYIPCDRKHKVRLQQHACHAARLLAAATWPS